VPSTPAAVFGDPSSRSWISVRRLTPSPLDSICQAHYQRRR
jgi:hypothetical protein